MSSGRPARDPRGAGGGPGGPAARPGRHRGEAQAGRDDAHFSYLSMSSSVDLPEFAVSKAAGWGGKRMVWSRQGGAWAHFERANQKRIEGNLIAWPASSPLPRRRDRSGDDAAFLVEASPSMGCVLRTGAGTAGRAEMDDGLASRGRDRPAKEPARGERPWASSRTASSRTWRPERARWNRRTPDTHRCIEPPLPYLGGPQGGRRCRHGRPGADHVGLRRTRPDAGTASKLSRARIS